MVVAVSDKSEKIVGRGVRTSHGSSEWSAETQRAANFWRRAAWTQGQVSVALHCRQCEGLVRHPDGSLQKRFGKTESLLPAQLALAADPSPSPRLTERPAADADADDLGGPGDVALYLGRSHFGAVATVANGVAGKGLDVSWIPFRRVPASVDASCRAWRAGDTKRRTRWRRSWGSRLAG